MNKDINQLSTQLGAALLSKSAIVTTAESCTGGGVAQRSRILRVAPSGFIVAILLMPIMQSTRL